MAIGLCFSTLTTLRCANFKSQNSQARTGPQIPRIEKHSCRACLILAYMKSGQGEEYLTQNNLVASKILKSELDDHRLFPP